MATEEERVAELQRQAAEEYAAAQAREAREAEARNALAFARMHGNEAASS